MQQSLLLGMAATLLLVLSWPVSLLLCALPQRAARRVTRWMDALYMRVVTHPVIAATLDVGGLGVVYETGLFHAMHTHPWIAAAVHVNVFVSGLLFTAAITQIEPAPHRRSFILRACVLIVAIAAHVILAKRIYANGDLGMSLADTQRGAMLMYYLGDAIDLTLIILVCADWYRRKSAVRASPRARHRDVT